LYDCADEGQEEPLAADELDRCSTPTPGDSGHCFRIVRVEDGDEGDDQSEALEFARPSTPTPWACGDDEDDNTESAGSQTPNCSFSDIAAREEALYWRGLTVPEGQDLVVVDRMMQYYVRMLTGMTGNPRERRLQAENWLRTRGMELFGPVALFVLAAALDLHSVCGIVLDKSFGPPGVRTRHSTLAPLRQLGVWRTYLTAKYRLVLDDVLDDHGYALTTSRAKLEDISACSLVDWMLSDTQCVLEPAVNSGDWVPA
jgi:hypothetical protein